MFEPTEAEFKEFEPRLKYSWFHLKFNSIFKDLSRGWIETGFCKIQAAAQIHWIRTRDKKKHISNRRLKFGAKFIDKQV